MFLTYDSTSPSYVLVSSSQHVTEKQALAKVIGKVVVTQTQSSTFGSVLVPHCYARPTVGNATGNASNARNTTTFPITFSSACFAVCVTQNVNAAGNAYTSASRVMSISKTDFIWGTNSGSSYWFAVGY